MIIIAVSSFCLQKKNIRGGDPIESHAREADRQRRRKINAGSRGRKVFGALVWVLVNAVTRGVQLT